ncbi:DMT family transporter [Streptomyces smyrnaeus]|uniref:DMT family transporter n=1 Tax=Streptomyces TaxID=1883 RepID=UPI000C518831|nr:MULTISPECIES: DMT family transporter [unclassified Streptomyces]MBQ0862341.1 DMT family transporter [Streptomyces sp. RK75]MBQ1124474.1 DMT family transporter [Streptomyces sp. B15]MBQ1162836.1 DMT family transporter [Streptomyces sp. A73]
MLWTAVSVLLAVLAALGNAAASVLQRRAAAVERPGPSGRRLSWLPGLLRRPIWLWGAATLVLSAVCQAGALATGPLAVVQPVMTTELLFTLMLGGLMFRQRPGRRAWAAFGAMVVGLAALLWLVWPSGGSASVPPGRWLVAAPLMAGLVVVLVVVAFRLPSAPRATVLGSATAVLFGVTAALMKDAISHLADDGLVALLTAWQTYGVAVAGVAGFLMLQLTLHAGTLVASQPALTLGDAFLSVVLGAALFDERLSLGWRVAPEVVALALISVGSVQLARTPAVSGASEEEIW